MDIGNKSSKSGLNNINMNKQRPIYFYQDGGKDKGQLHEMAFNGMSSIGAIMVPFGTPENNISISKWNRRIVVGTHGRTSGEMRLYNENDNAIVSGDATALAVLLLYSFESILYNLSGIDLFICHAGTSGLASNLSRLVDCAVFGGCDKINFNNATWAVGTGTTRKDHPYSEFTFNGMGTLKDQRLSKHIAGAMSRNCL